MALPTIICGLLCVAIGLFGYLNQDANKVSVTALIPAFFGSALIVCGLLAFKESLRKHVMHLAALLGLLGIVGGFMPLMRQAGLIQKAAAEAGETISFGQSLAQLDWLKPSAISGWSMTLVSVVFVVLCIRSFALARKAREERAQQEALAKLNAATHPEQAIG